MSEHEKTDETLNRVINAYHRLSAAVTLLQRIDRDAGTEDYQEEIALKAYHSAHSAMGEALFDLQKSLRPDMT